MPKLRNILLLIVIGFGFWHFYGDTLRASGVPGVFGKMQTDFNSIKENPKINETIESLQSQVQDLFKISSQEEQLESKQKSVEKPKLKDPVDQTFSIHNIEIGHKRSEVEKKTGAPQRSTTNEYGVDWVAYHERYQNFLMVAYDENDRVAGLYTNQDLISSSIGVHYGTARETVLATQQDPLEYIRKGWVSYQLNSNDEYDLFLIGDQYVTIFYDQQENNTVTAILIINEELEQRKEQIYGEPSDELKEGFEYQLFDLTNAARVKNGLPTLDWDEDVKETARSHSTDMAENGYFNHTNLAGKSPFDRMSADNIKYQMAGENIAMGQFSSIFAHEGLMNSPGHRKNILQKDFEALGIGVGFNQERQPYFTENFLTP
ncbi:CAP domain-containing protein [Lederbergia galactosidilytica]|uniref:Serine protease n=1 Tax=Lederbergia galactosidilytica TaxID=217031 RepID=A0A177ZLB7_9BACI|nr:CAP domain-containing protein [Lederbergia galactosidilytica]KRG14499.1 serine protease [Virgibacillus soli]OAK68239.1 serine protease [Lederbergia galactosidilytica]